MDAKTIKRILNNHKIIPFVDDLLNKVDRSLVIAKEGNVWIVFSGDPTYAIKKKNYIEFEDEEDANEFVANYRKAFYETPVEEMDQHEYETMRGSVRWKYEGTIERVE